MTTCDVVSLCDFEHVYASCVLFMFGRCVNQGFRFVEGWVWKIMISQWFIVSLEPGLAYHGFHELEIVVFCFSQNEIMRLFLHSKRA